MMVKETKFFRRQADKAAALSGSAKGRSVVNFIESCPFSIVGGV
jgi:hypothetical protein